MNTETESKQKKVAQITVNVSAEDKVRVNSIKEELKLTDKELVSVLLDLFDGLDQTAIKEKIETVQREKALAKVKARLEKLEKEQAELKAQVAGEAESEEAESEESAAA